MKLAVFYNPIASSGKGKQLAEEFVTQANSVGTLCELIETQPQYTESFGDTLSIFDAVVVAGGDGTVRSIAAYCIERNLPLGMIPAGNESLFARSCGYKDISSLLNSVLTSAHRPWFPARLSRDTDSSKSTAQRFFLMASIGFDATTISLLGPRFGRLNDRKYLTAGLKTLFQTHHPRVDITVDGESFIRNKQGYVLISKDSSYARNLDPCPEATGARQQLWVTFIEGSGALQQIIWGAAMAVRKTLPTNFGGRKASGNKVTVTLHSESAALQVDGDLMAPLRQGELIEMEVDENALQVIGS